MTRHATRCARERSSMRRVTVPSNVEGADGALLVGQLALHSSGILLHTAGILGCRLVIRCGKAMRRNDVGMVTGSHLSHMACEI